MNWPLLNGFVDFAQALAIAGLTIEVVRLRRRAAPPLSELPRITVSDDLLEELRDAHEWGATTVPIEIRLEEYRAGQDRGPYRTRVDA